MTYINVLCLASAACNSSWRLARIKSLPDDCYTLVQRGRLLESGLANRLIKLFTQAKDLRLRVFSGPLLASNDGVRSPVAVVGDL